MDSSKHQLFNLLLQVFFLISHNLNFSHAAAIISSTQSITGNQTITSDGGNFVIGFFSPGNSRNHYIGIWYKKVSLLTPVWVANREQPVTDPSASELTISEGGNLVLLGPSRSTTWSTNLTSIPANSTVAELLDTGNLVLRDRSNSSKLLWQSFDHPTDTWLPGAKLGLNKLTGENQLLTSWTNSEDPAPGIYSLQIDPNGTSQYLIQRNRTRTYWSSGTWNGQIFSGVPEMTANYIYDFAYVPNAQENYFNYSVRDSSIITRFVMGLSGQIQQFTWLENSQAWNLFWSQPRAQCEVYSLCGPFGVCTENGLPYCSCLKGFSEASPRDWNLRDVTGGCVRNTHLNCGGNGSVDGDQDRFLVMNYVKPPEDPRVLQVGSEEECESACLTNCTCTAYSYDGGCSLWYENLLNLQQLSDGSSNGINLRLRLAASELPTSKSKKGIITGAVTGAVAGLIALSGIVWFLVWRQRRREFSKLKVVEGTLIPFRYDDLRRVTKGFSNRLGGGGFGSVFKATLPDSTVVAVKKLEGIEQGEKQFRTEVSTIGTIQHVNLVRLHGFCSEGTKKLLVYEYMPMGSLDAVLLRNGPLIVSWKIRYQIALGIARGLAYLHEKCRDCIIHCDIKPENILLDDHFIPKVADFGLAKLVGREFSRVLTTMRGTRGYLAPEWISGLPITAKADVYSYGMMLFEIISGRRNTENAGEEGGPNFFPSWAARKLIGGEVLSLLDPRLERGDADSGELERLCKTACWCIQDDDNQRPSMGLVVQILEGVLDVNLPPIPRSLMNLSDNSEHIIFFSDESNDSKQSAQNQNTVSGCSEG